MGASWAVGAAGGTAGPWLGLGVRGENSKKEERLGEVAGRVTPEVKDATFTIHGPAGLTQEISSGCVFVGVIHTHTHHRRAPYLSARPSCVPSTSFSFRSLSPLYCTCPLLV